MPEHVLFAYNAYSQTDEGQLKPDTSSTGRQQLAELLRDRDLTTVISFGAETAFDESDAVVWAHELTMQDTVGARLGSLALNEPGGVRFMVNRAGRRLELPDLESGLPPRFNTNAVRTMGYYKDHMTDAVLRPLGFAIPTVLVSNCDEVEPFLYLHTATSFAAKPNAGGGASRGVHMLERGEVVDRFNREKDWQGRYILQPKVDATQPFPASIQAYDTATRQLFEESNQSGQHKEIRMYTAYAAGVAMVFPVARLVFPPDGQRTTSNDTWFYVDPNTIPTRVYKGAKACVTRLASETQAEATWATFDYVHGTIGDTPPDWYVMEGSTRSPYFLDYDKHPGIAAKIRTILADQAAAAVYGR